VKNGLKKNLKLVWKWSVRV